MQMAFPGDDENLRSNIDQCRRYEYLSVTNENISRILSIRFVRVFIPPTKKNTMTTFWSYSMISTLVRLHSIIHVPKFQKA